jgi:hypothetical protein
MIKSASYRICLIDGNPIEESEPFKQLMKVSVRAAVKSTMRITVSFDEIRRRGSDELNEVINHIGYVPLNKRSEAS